MDELGDINVLVVNDNPDHLALMEIALRKVGYGVLTAPDGGAAFETALRERVDIIISDVMMPNVNGIELCRLVRGHPALQSLPILLVSALRKDTETVVEGLRSGADAYVESPFELTHLVAVIARLIERKRSEDHTLRLNEELEVRVRERTAQLEAANLELEREVAERRVIESDLEKARDEALVAARLKAEFLANVSHEIRTPMHAVLGMVGLLLKTPLRPKQAEFAEAIRESADSLLSVINDVLDLSKIEAGKLRVDKTDFDLSDIVEASAHMFLERARAKGLSLGCLIDDGVPTLLRGDPGRLRQVLVNLLSNAVKFTEAGAVTLEVTRGREAGGHVTLRFEVRDTGIGISREARRRIFLPFTQADGSDSRPYGGTGLGLTISRQLVELMGGEIGVESESGRGSTFWFTVRFEEQPGGATAAERSGLDGLRVLVVGPDAANRQILVQQAGQWNMLVEAAGDAGRALGLLRERQAEGAPFAFALLEPQTLHGGGIELARQIRADARLGGTRLILITSSVLGHDEEAEYERLFDAFLTIPMRRLQLKDCLLTLVNRDRRDGAVNSPEADAPPPASPGGGRRILVAEDSPVNQMLMTHLLEELGFGAVVVPNGVGALDACARGEYAMVLMDCQMPEMDGYEATAELRRREGAGRRTPVIALTADAMPGTRQRCLAAGMDGYLSKPFTREELEAVIAEWDERRVVRAADSDALEEDAAVDDVLDLRLIERLHAFREQGDVSTIVRLIDTFLQDINTRRDAINEAYGSRDRERVRREAHALKGSAGFFGAVRLSKVCAELMAPATGDGLPPAREALKRLDDELLYVTRKLEAWRYIHPA